MLRRVSVMRRKDRRWCSRALAIICRRAHGTEPHHMSELAVGLADKNHRRQEHQQVDAVKRRAVLGIAPQCEEGEYARGLDEGKPLDRLQQITSPEHPNQRYPG